MQISPTFTTGLYSFMRLVPMFLESNPKSFDSAISLKRPSETALYNAVSAFLWDMMDFVGRQSAIPRSYITRNSLPDLIMSQAVPTMPSDRK